MTATAFAQANKLFKEGKVEEAITLYKKATTESNQFYCSHHNLGEALIEAGRIEEAAAAFRGALAINPNSAWSLHKLGTMLNKLGQYEEAVGYLCQAVAKIANVPEFYLSLGTALVHLGQWSEAEENLYHVVQFSPNSLPLNEEAKQVHGTSLITFYVSEAYFYLAEIKSGQQQWSEAVEFYRQSWESNPGKFSCCLGLAASLGKLGRWSEAVELYRQNASLFDESGEFLFGFGQALGQLGRWDEAITEYRKAINLGFAGAGVRHHLGYALGQLGRWDEAVVEYRLVVEVNPKSAQMRHQLGYGLMRLGRWGEAEIELRRAVELYPGSAVVWQQLGDVLRELGEDEESVEVYRKALEIEPGLVREELVTQSGDKAFNSHKSQQNSSNDSRVAKNDGVKSEQSLVVSLYEERLFKSAQSHLVKQEHDRAIDKCSSIIAANPIFTDVFPVLGAAYQKNNQLQKAEAFLKTTQHIRNLIATKTVEKIWGPVVRRSPESENDKTFDRQKQNSINKIVIYTCVWRRPELTRIVLSYYSGLKKELSGKIQLELLAVGSEGDASRKLCEDCGFDYFEYANQPLSAKWEYGINRCAGYDPDGVIIVGSDDLISQNLIEFYDSQLKNNMVFCGLKDGYFFDVSKENLILWTGYNLQSDPTRLGETIGMGRCLSRFLLDKFGFSIWKGLNINRGLDGAMSQKFFQLGLQVLDYDNCVVAKVDNQEVRIGHCGFEMADIGVCAVDIKFAENLTDFERYEKFSSSPLVPQVNPWDIVEKYFPHSIVHQLKELAILTEKTQHQEPIKKDKGSIASPYSNLQVLLEGHQSLSERVILANSLQASEALSKIISSSTKDFNNLNKQDFQEGVLLLQQSKYEAALKLFKELLDENSNYLLYYYLGECLNHLGKWKEAVEAYKESNRLNPKFVNSYARCGDVFMKLEQWDSAKDQFYQAVSALLL